MQRMPSMRSVLVCLAVLTPSFVTSAAEPEASPSTRVPTASSPGNTVAPFDGEKSTWHDGFNRYDYLMDESTLAITPFKAPDGEKFAVQDPPAGKRRCVVVAPKKP